MSVNSALRKCTCEKPSLHPVPARAAKGLCVKCEGEIPRRRSSTIVLTCARCKDHFNPDTEGRAGLYIDRGGEGAEKLRLQEVIQLCGECAEVVRSFIGLRPDRIYR